MRKLHFLKMHGCGNDFIVFDDEAGHYSWHLLSKLAPVLCDRRFGVGADGLIAVGQCDEADYEMKYVNADGSRAEMCGNGIRCLGKYVADELGFAGDVVSVLTGAGVLTLELERSEGRVSAVAVSMGLAVLEPARIPTTLPELDGSVRKAHVRVADTDLELTAVSMGNPHAVSFVPEISDYHVHGLGPLVEKHPAFPRKVNAEFVQMLTPQELRMRVWERGCGETWACGTGACASVVAAVLNGHAQFDTDVLVHLNGGDLTIRWPSVTEPVMMRGPAETVFRGEVLIDA